jgi:hypothetical protein
MEILNRNRIDVYATFILQPDYSKRDFKRLEKTMKRLGIRFANLQPLTPLPGVDYQVDEKQLIIKRSDWEKWDLAHVTVQPTGMSIGEFYGETLRLYERMIDHPANVIKNLKYPPHMQFRILKGISRIRRQYRNVVRESFQYA